MSELDAQNLPDPIVETEPDRAGDEELKKDVNKAKNPRIDRVRNDGPGQKKGNGPSNNMRRRTESWSQKDLQLSRALAGILRHGMMGFQPDEHGFLFLDDILQHHHFKQVLNVTYDDLKRVAKEIEDKKGHQMFELISENDGKLLKVRARKPEKTAGDSSRDEEVTLKKAAEYPVCIHGTYWKAWEDMKQKGISRLGRNHIHFCSGMIGKDGNVAGIRPNCEVLVYLDLKRAITDRIKFYRDERGVLWSDGNKEGFIPPKYFTHAVHVSPTTGQSIYCEDLADLKDNEGEARPSKPSSRPSSSARGHGGGRSGGGRGGRGGRGGNRGNRGGNRGGGDRGNEAASGGNKEGAAEDGNNRNNRRNNRNNRNRNRNQKPAADSKVAPNAKGAEKTVPSTDSSTKTAQITEQMEKVDLKKTKSEEKQ